jgi:hypothetical protein
MPRLLRLHRGLLRRQPRHRLLRLPDACEHRPALRVGLRGRPAEVGRQERRRPPRDLGVWVGQQLLQQLGPAADLAVIA